MKNTNPLKLLQMRPDWVRHTIAPLLAKSRRRSVSPSSPFGMRVVSPCLMCGRAIRLRPGEEPRECLSCFRLIRFRERSLAWLMRSVRS